MISEPAELTQLIQLDVSTSQAAAITQIVPSQEATRTPTPTQTVTPTPTVTPTELPPQPTGPGFGGWLISLLSILVVGGGCFLEWE